ncbi:hypothetical protein NPIL_98821 [Nephila pilipes]|uniref:Uncharacterized protein n=1 Tax=Nephila pilipes TaxID=299642 RepID=A0A8X6QP45_NEPPI|nr:hypothetical protein NPIL_98821 [Nephila pilipes]
MNVRLRILTTICARVVHSYTFLRRFHTVGSECPPAQWILHMKNESQCVIRTLREKRVRAPSLTVAKPKMRVRRQLAGAWTGRKKANLHSSVAKSLIAAFLASAALWEPYFKDIFVVM